MKNSLLMNFSVDKENVRILVKKEFAAPVALVWRAWTDSTMLDRWWGPKPWRAKTKKMDFREGGYWHYAMMGPDGEVLWGRADYLSITIEKNFKGKDSFCDEEGTINMEYPQSQWNTDFSRTANNLTMVQIETTFDSLESLEKNLEMGFKEGFTGSMDNLDRLLGELGA